MKPNPYRDCDAEHKATIEPYIGQSVDIYDTSLPDPSGNAPRAYHDLTPAALGPNDRILSVMVLLGVVIIPALIGFVAGVMVGGGQ